MTTVFQKPGRFWKANLHTHSSCSDGMLSPEQVCAVYRKAGYHILAITDHFSERYNYPITDTSPYQSEEFLTLLGAELHAPQIELGDTWHIIAVGLPADFAPNLPGETGASLAQRALQAGAFVSAPHPGWYSLSEADVLSLGGIHAVEVFNGTAIDDNDRADGWYLVERLLATGYRYLPLAADDAHFSPERDDVLQGWVWVKSEKLTQEAVLSALKAGDYYSSTGPQIYCIEVIPGEKVVVECSPVSHIFVTGRGGNFASAQGTSLMRAEIPLDGFSGPYCRITVRDSLGKRAWSNPIWF